MFRGTKALNLDAKGRLAIPRQYHAELAERCGGQLVATIAGDRATCLWLYPLDGWEAVAAKVGALPSFNAAHQELNRRFIGSANDLEMDKSGRVLLPPTLRQRAQLEREIHLVGQGNKFELWNARLWNEGIERWQSEPLDPDKISPEMEQLTL